MAPRSNDAFVFLAGILHEINGAAGNNSTLASNLSTLADGQMMKTINRERRESNTMKIALPG
jgi:hypothetical protein